MALCSAEKMNQCALLFKWFTCKYKKGKGEHLRSHLTMHWTIGLTDYYWTTKSDGLMGYRTIKCDPNICYLRVIWQIYGEVNYPIT